jgi:hypothetical protein
VIQHPMTISKRQHFDISAKNGVLLLSEAKIERHMISVLAVAVFCRRENSILIHDIVVLGCIAELDQ